MSDKDRMLEFVKRSIAQGGTGDTRAGKGLLVLQLKYFKENAGLVDMDVRDALEHFATEMTCRTERLAPVSGINCDSRTTVFLQIAVEQLDRDGEICLFALGPDDLDNVVIQLPSPAGGTGG